MKLSMICTICTPLNTASTGKEREKPKNAVQMRHSCTLSGREQPQEPFASTSSPSPSKMERGLGGKKDTGYLYKGPPQLRQPCQKSQSHASLDSW
jgi:hypothetical protein